jgi:hypothetical protein
MVFQVTIFQFNVNDRSSLSVMSLFSLDVFPRFIHYSNAVGIIRTTGLGGLRNSYLLSLIQNQGPQYSALSKAVVKTLRVEFITAMVPIVMLG